MWNISLVTGIKVLTTSFTYTLKKKMWVQWGVHVSIYVSCTSETIGRIPVDFGLKEPALNLMIKINFVSYHKLYFARCTNQIWSNFSETACRTPDSTCYETQMLFGICAKQGRLETYISYANTKFLFIRPESSQP